MTKTSANNRRRTSKKTSHSRTARVAAKKTSVSRKGTSRPASHRRIHVTPASSASEILDALSISTSDVEAAREAIESS